MDYKWFVSIPLFMVPLRQLVCRFCQAFSLLFATLSLPAAVNVALTEVPDYEWWAGCFGTASGNLIGYWDRHGFPDFYTGPTANGRAPLTSSGSNSGIRALWASQAGVDGRPLNQPGHYDDYYLEYESTAPDPYQSAHRAEHAPDSIGDFLGLNQRKWANLGEECAGNIDGFSFIFWDSSGDRRLNFSPVEDGQFVPDIQSGLRQWTAFKGAAADVFTQLTDFNPTVPTGKGFTFADLKTEIDHGYPVLLFLQHFDELSRPVGTLANANPHIHGMLAYGYRIDDNGTLSVRYNTSWASGSRVFSQWSAQDWQAELPVRGVIGYHPLPQITAMVRETDRLTVRWIGPSSVVTNSTAATSFQPHWYVLEKAAALSGAAFEPVSDPTTDRELTITNCCDAQAFYRIRLVYKTETD